MYELLIVCTILSAAESFEDTPSASETNRKNLFSLLCRPSPWPSDWMLASRCRSLLSLDRELAASSIRIRAKNGTIHLRGTVPSPDAHPSCATTPTGVAEAAKTRQTTRPIRAPEVEEEAGMTRGQKTRRAPPRGSRIRMFSNDMSDSNDEPLVTAPSSSVWTVAESLQIRSRTGS